MPSSISNSKNRNWAKSWIIALVIVALLLLSLELFWRSNGHTPNIVDDHRLWANERSKIGKSQKEIALLGSSRMQTDISTATLHRLLPDYSIINLSADSTCGNAVLRDLAGDNNFRGIVILDTGSECLMFGDEQNLSQQFFVDYFHNTYNHNIKLNRHITTFVQKNLTIADPYLNLIKVMGYFVAKKQWRTPNYLTTHEDRTRAADYTKLDIAHHKTIRLDKIDKNYRTLAPDITVNLLAEKVNNLDHAVKKIQSRGGHVVFVRFPVSDEHWVIDETYFPRYKYWDTIIPLTSATVIHFQDIDGMNKFQCPDTSHLDFRDTRTFTTLLLNKLFKEKII